MSAQVQTFRQDAAIIGLVSFGHGMSHFFQLILPPLFPFIKDDLGVSYAQLGFVAALFYFMSGVFQPLAGFVVDRHGPRAVLLWGMGLLAGGTALAGLAQNYTQLVLCAAIMGLGNSVFHPADFAVLNGRVAPQRLAHAYSTHGVLGMLGYAVAPIYSASVGLAYGWHAALLSGAAIGFGVFVLFVINAGSLTVQSHAPKANSSVAQDLRMLAAPVVVMCFLYFTLYAAALSGVQNFTVAALREQFDLAAALASSALTLYFVGSAAGIVAGGFAAARTKRHDVVAAGGLVVGGGLILMVALGWVGGLALPALFAVSGFMVGATGPSRDLIVRASTPSGSTGKVYGFVYSGFDVGGLLMPVFYGWLIDQHLPQGVFYTVFGLTLLAILTVLNLPGRVPGGYTAARQS